MMKELVFFIATALITAAGGVSGMGGGIIIKPLLDLTGGFSPETAGVMSSSTVLAMAAVSTWHNMRGGAEIKRDVAVTVALGSTAGGLIGQQIFAVLAASVSRGGIVVAVQNVVLFVLVAVILVYMKKKESIRSRRLKGIVPVFAAGMLLGVIASFLGIGGGPMNVALFIFLFSYGTKSAAVCSLITILFAQISKLLLAAAGGQFAGVSPALLAPMIAGGVAGGFIAGAVSRRLTDRGVDIIFNVIQVCVLAVCVVNIVSAP